MSPGKMTPLVVCIQGWVGPSSAKANVLTGEVISRQLTPSPIEIFLSINFRSASLFTPTPLHSKSDGSTQLFRCCGGLMRKTIHHLVLSNVVCGRNAAPVSPEYHCATLRNEVGIFLGTRVEGELSLFMRSLEFGNGKIDFLVVFGAFWSFQPHFWITQRVCGVLQQL